MFLLALALTGCNLATPIVSLDDSVDVDWGLSTDDAPRARLHSPYVRGAQFRLSANHSEDGGALVGWSIVSDDPSILALGAAEMDSGVLDVEATAVRSGTVRVSLVDAAGEVVVSEQVVVATPDAFELHAHGPVMLDGEPSAVSRRDAPRVLVGGTAVLLVRWFADGVELGGSGALVAEAGPDTEVAAERSYLFEDREWLAVTPTAAGAREVTVSAGGVVIGAVTVEGVAADAVADVVLDTEAVGGAAAGDTLRVLSRARDGAGAPIEAVPVTWAFEGVEADEIGDLYRYTYDPAVTADLTATWGEVVSATTIHAARPGEVGSSNTSTCAVGGPAGGLAVLLALGLVARRR